MMIMTNRNTLSIRIILLSLVQSASVAIVGCDGGHDSSQFRSLGTSQTESASDGPSTTFPSPNMKPSENQGPTESRNPQSSEDISGTKGSTEDDDHPANVMGSTPDTQSGSSTSDDSSSSSGSDSSSSSGDTSSSGGESAPSFIEGSSMDANSPPSDGTGGESSGSTALTQEEFNACAANFAANTNIIDLAYVTASTVFTPSSVLALSLKGNQTFSRIQLPISSFAGLCVVTGGTSTVSFATTASFGNLFLMMSGNSNATISFQAPATVQQLSKNSAFSGNSKVTLNVQNCKSLIADFPSRNVSCS